MHYMLGVFMSFDAFNSPFINQTLFIFYFQIIYIFLELILILECGSDTYKFYLPGGRGGGVARGN